MEGYLRKVLVARAKKEKVVSFDLYGHVGRQL